jgi:hypothetical protein
MINLELLEIFTVEILKYRKGIKPIGFKCYSVFIYIMFEDMGETIKLNRYKDWYVNYRDKKIEKILNI